MSLKRLVLRAPSLAALILVSTICAVPQEQLPAVDGRAERAGVTVTSNKGHSSGFLATSTGIVVTALDVVDGASLVTVITQSGEVYDTVTLLVVDRRRRLAVLKINGHGLPFMDVGNSDQLKSGDRVTTFGYAFRKEAPTWSSKERIISNTRDLSSHNNLQLTPAVSDITSGWMVVGPNGKLLGFVTQNLEPDNTSLAIIASKQVREALKSVDQTNPIFQWRGSSTTFNEKPLIGISGYWKSSNGSVYHLVEDRVGRINITNMSAPKFRYDAHWEGNLLIGIGYNDDKKRFVLRVSDSDHLLRGIFKFEANENKETIIRRAQEKLKRPDDVWVRIH